LPPAWAISTTECVPTIPSDTYPALAQLVRAALSLPSLTQVEQVLSVLLLGL
jgi:hypothetical protein